jgi:hypothetical protein
MKINRRAYGLLVLALCFVLAASPALAADIVSSIDVPVLAAPPAMTGVVDDSWAKAATVTLDTDYNYRRPAEEPTKVYVAQEGGYLDIAFVVTQKESQTAGQETNSSSVLSEDYVGAFLYPQGTSGINYSFFANPHGARFQTSSENTAYTPQWTAVGRGTPGGYTVTMRIPLNIIRSGGSTKWKAQFVRNTVATNGLSVWTFSPRESNATDAAFIGTLVNVGTGPAGASGSARAKARFGVYGLGEITPPSNGGNTSRVGADFSIPIDPTASFVGTLHPDYSNVEIDQQMIAPTAFARQFAEVRPFFTQAANYYNNHFSCTNCPQSLYTPNIPTFAQGYALEGTQGRLSFGAFDSIGTQRNDGAQALNYNYEDSNTIYSVNVQHVGVSVPGLSDQTTTFSSGYDDQRTHLFAYFNAGQDRGTNVTDPAIGNYLETGIGYLDATTIGVLNVQDIGAQYNPVDGFVSQTDIQGYEMFGSKTLNFSPKAMVHDVSGNVFYGRYNNRFDQLAQANTNASFNIDFRDLLTVHLTASSQGVRIFDGEYLPFQGNGALLGYRYNTPTPSYVSFSGGNYYHGTLAAWVYLTTLPVMPKVHLTLETDEDQYLSSWPGETVGRQWLERAGLDWQFNRQASFDVGARRIIGLNLPNAIQPLAYNSPPICLANPYNPGCFVNATNVTLAFHFLAARNEFYVVYGDANNLSTEPALFVKWIRYIGASKGT